MGDQWSGTLAGLYRRQRDRLLTFLTDVADWLTALERHAGQRVVRLPVTLPEALAILRVRLMRMERWVREATPRAPRMRPRAMVERLCDWPPCSSLFLAWDNPAGGALTCSLDCRRLRQRWLDRNRVRVFGSRAPGRLSPRRLRLRELTDFDPNL